MKYALLAALVALSACSTSLDRPGAMPAQPLNCAYADSHCAHGKS